MTAKPKQTINFLKKWPIIFSEKSTAESAVVGVCLRDAGQTTQRPNEAKQRHQDNQEHSFYTDAVLDHGHSHSVTPRADNRNREFAVPGRVDWMDYVYVFDYYNIFKPVV